MVITDGAGGKGTWGKLLDIDGEAHLDRNDPNYDSGEVIICPLLLDIFAFEWFAVAWTLFAQVSLHMTSLLALTSC